MFDINNKEMIKMYVSKRIPTAIMIPMYVSLYNQKYDLNSLSEITSYSPSDLKIGFGSCNSILEKNPFPMNRMYEVDVVSLFKDFDSSKNIDVSYIVFESGSIVGDTSFHEQINYYYDILNEYISKIVCEYKRNLLQNMEK